MRAYGWLVTAGLVACAPAGTSSPGVGATPVATTAPSTPTDSLSVDSTPTAELVEDQYVQLARQKVDLLYVVQDTPGMGEAQASLADHIPLTFDWLIGSGIDYHLGLVTTDCEDPAESGQLLEAAGQRWIDEATANPIEVFAAMSAIGEDAAPHRVQPRGAAYLALEVERDRANAGFYREDAGLSVVVVGDGTDDTDPSIVEPEAFEAWFAALKPGPGLAGYSCLLAPGATAEGCADTALALGGEVLSMDDPDAFTVVGREATGLSASWPLSRLPVPETLEVEVESPAGSTLAFTSADWVWDPVTNAVSFVEYVPSPLSVITLRYLAAE